MPSIKLPSRFSDNFGDPIQSIINLLSDINQYADEEEITLNYDDARFTHPFFSLSLPLIEKQFNRLGRNINVSRDFQHAVTIDYMGYLHFPYGVDPGMLHGQEFGEFLSQYEHKSYLPIINFPVDKSEEASVITRNFLSAINTMLLKICGLSGVMSSALMYLIDEAVANIIDHSDDDKGYLLAQYFKSKGYLDIVIADIGKTLLESYQTSEKHNADVLSDNQAMEAALAGKSTKSTNVDRGFGISTSKEMLTNGLNGKYFLWSGNVFNIHTSEINNVVNIPNEIRWQGVYLCLRIPVIPKPGFNLYDFVEN